jgi:cell wall-associated NlpC family hydrolase
MITREQIVEEARSWIATPFEHQHRVKGRAVDCVGLLIGVARALRIVPSEFDFTGYSRLPDGRSLIEQADMHMTRIARIAMQPGDAVAIAYDGDPQHFGLLTPYRHGGLAIVHAASRYGCVIETRLMFGSSPLTPKFVAAYRLPGVG